MLLGWASRRLLADNGPISDRKIPLNVYSIQITKIWKVPFHSCVITLPVLRPRPLFSPTCVWSFRIYFSPITLLVNILGQALDNHTSILLVKKSWSELTCHWLISDYITLALRRHCPRTYDCSWTFSRVLWVNIPMTVLPFHLHACSHSWFLLSEVLTRSISYAAYASSSDRLAIWDK